MIRKIIKYCFCGIFLLILTLSISIGIFFTYINYWNYDFDPKLVDEFLSYKPPLATEILDRNGKTLIELPGIGNWEKRIPEYRRWVKYEDVPEIIRYALIVAEDQRFFSHNGLDYIGILRAIKKNIEESVIATQKKGYLVIGSIEGASTLTQEALEFTLLRYEHEKEISVGFNADEKWNNKIKKMRMAVWLEKKLHERFGDKKKAKEKIMEVVFNASYWGHGQYGIKQASKFAFAKELNQLSVPEAVVTILTFPNPWKYSPYINYTHALLRRNLIIGEMGASGYIRAEDLDQYLKEPISLREQKRIKSEAPAAVSYIMKELWSKNTDAIRWDNGIKVKSTIDLDAQRIANTALEYGLNLFKIRQNEHLKESKNLSDSKFFRSRRDGVQGALVVLQNGTGEILAMVGGANNDYVSFNRASEAMRQPGSSFKTFVYGAAVEKGWSEYRIDCLRWGSGICRISDSPISVKMGRGRPRHRIKNYDKRVFGKIPLWVAFARSQNMAAMHLARQVGVDDITDFANRLGLVYKIESYPTTAIGAEEVTVLGLAAAYAAFPNRGLYAKPFAVREIIDSENNKKEYWALRKRAIDNITASEMVELMRHTVLYKSGTGRKLNEDNYPVEVAGKTGTTNKYRDAWFVGFTDGEEGITVAVWIGMDDDTPLASDIDDDIIQNEKQHCKPLHPIQKEYCEAGGKTALPAVKYFIEEYYRGKKPPKFPESMNDHIKYVQEFDYDPTR